MRVDKLTLNIHAFAELVLPMLDDLRFVEFVASTSMPSILQRGAIALRTRQRVIWGFNTSLASAEITILAILGVPGHCTCASSQPGSRSLL
jgi:hypothetical protein